MWPLQQIRDGDTFVPMWPAKAGAFVTSAVGVVGGIGTSTAWLKANVSPRAAHLAALGILIVSAGIVALLALPLWRSAPPASEITSHGRWPSAGHYKLWHWLVFTGVLALAMLSNAEFISPRTSGNVADYITAYFYVSLAAIPIFWLLYQRDKEAHRECPMCCERIKARARICRYCGSRMSEVT